MLAAIMETIAETQDSTEVQTNTAYWAALMSTLERAFASASSEDGNTSAIAAIVYLLSLVCQMLTRLSVESMDERKKHHMMDGV